MDGLEKTLLTAGKLAEGGDCETQTVRRYDKLGLLKPVARDSAGRRLYLGRPEAMLAAQAHSLDAIFTSLARRAHLNMGEYVNAADRYMRLALKAQSQCRATIETLAAIKNPPMVIARQANIAHGPQQVNNGEPTRTREIQSEPSKLLEQTHGERLDTRTTGQASGADSAMATMGAQHRAKDK
jgi:DNA-binding transcriptional MerR regulator